MNVLCLFVLMVYSLLGNLYLECLCVCVPLVKIEQSAETLDILQDPLKGIKNNTSKENQSYHGRRILYNSQCAWSQHCWKGIVH